MISSRYSEYFGGRSRLFLTRHLVLHIDWQGKVNGWWAAFLDILGTRVFKDSLVQTRIEITMLY